MYCLTEVTLSGGISEILLYQGGFFFFKGGGKFYLRRDSQFRGYDL